MSNFITAALRQKYKGGKRLPRLAVAPPPVGLEREYLRDLMPYLEQIQRSVKTIYLPELRSIFTEYDSYKPIAMKKRDSAGADIIRLASEVGLQVSRVFTPEEIRGLAARQGVSISSYNKRIQSENIRRVVGFDLFLSEPYLAGEIASFAWLNADLITSLKTDTTQKIQRLTFEALQTGMRHEELAEQIEKYIDPSIGNTRSRAEFIARDQVSKLNGQLTKVRQQELGLSRYTWRTSGDDRVRDSHLAHDGKVFRWDDPPADTGHPGEDYQCRCYAEPVLQDLVES